MTASEVQLGEMKVSWMRPFATIAGIYVAPTVLLAAGVIPFRWRFYVLIAMTLTAVALGIARGHTLAKLGMGIPRFWVIFRWAILPSVLVAGAVLASDVSHRMPVTARLPFFVFFALIAAPAQEFLYRSFLFAELGAMRLPRFAIVLVSALLFCSMHVIYRDYLTVFLTFAVGLIWAVSFLRSNSFYSVALSHAAVGIAAIFMGVI